MGCGNSKEKKPPQDAKDKDGPKPRSKQGSRQGSRRNSPTEVTSPPDDPFKRVSTRNTNSPGVNRSRAGSIRSEQGSPAKGSNERSGRASRAGSVTSPNKDNEARQQPVPVFAPDAQQRTATVTTANPAERQTTPREERTSVNNAPAPLVLEDPTPRVEGRRNSRSSNDAPSPNAGAGASSSTVAAAPSPDAAAARRVHSSHPPPAEDDPATELKRLKGELQATRTALVAAQRENNELREASLQQHNNASGAYNSPYGYNGEVPEDGEDDYNDGYRSSRSSSHGPVLNDVMRPIAMRAASEAGRRSGSRGASHSMPQQQQYYNDPYGYNATSNNGYYDDYNTTGNNAANNTTVNGSYMSTALYNDETDGSDGGGDTPRYPHLHTGLSTRRRKRTATEVIADAPLPPLSHNQKTATELRKLEAMGNPKDVGTWAWWSRGGADPYARDGASQTTDDDDALLKLRDLRTTLEDQMDTDESPITCDLNRCSIHSQGCYSLSALLTTPKISHMSVVTTLDLGNNPIGDEGLGILFQAMTRHIQDYQRWPMPLVKRLSLSSCGLAHGCGLLIALHLFFGDACLFPNLEDLDLSYNDLTNDAFRTIMEAAVSGNGAAVTLKEIDFTECHLGPLTYVYLQDALKTLCDYPSALRTVTLIGHRFGSDAERLQLQAPRSLDLIFKVPQAAEGRRLSNSGRRQSSVGLYVPEGPNEDPYATSNGEYGRYRRVSTKMFADDMPPAASGDKGSNNNNGANNQQNVLVPQYDASGSNSDPFGNSKNWYNHPIAGRDGKSNATRAADRELSNSQRRAADGTGVRTPLAADGGVSNTNSVRQGNNDAAASPSSSRQLQDQYGSPNPQRTPMSRPNPNATGPGSPESPMVPPRRGANDPSPHANASASPHTNQRASVPPAVSPIGPIPPRDRYSPSVRSPSTDRAY